LEILIDNAAKSIGETVYQVIQSDN